MQSRAGGNQSAAANNAMKNASLDSTAGAGKENQANRQTGEKNKENSPPDQGSRSDLEAKGPSISNDLLNKYQTASATALEAKKRLSKGVSV